MSQVSKHVFADEELEVVTVMDDQGEKWFLANPFARILDYSNVNRAIRVHVNAKYQVEVGEMQVDQNGLVLKGIHPQSKFINRAGIFELINASKMPKAKEFRNWINAELLPQLCDNGDYNMKKDAPQQIQQAMNVVHQVTNDGESVSWMENDKMQVLQLKLELSQKDNVILEKNQELLQQQLDFQQRENKYQMVIRELQVQANMTLTEFGVQGLLAKDNMADNDELRANLRRVKNRVIPELSERPEKEHYTVCYEYEKKGAKRIRVTRTQLTEVERRDKIIEQYKDNPTKKNRAKQYEWLEGADKFLQIKCPNPISLWIKIRQLHPHECYGFKFTNRANTEIEFLNEDEIREKYRADMEMCKKNDKANDKIIANFQALQLLNEDDAVAKCLTPSLEAKDRLARLIQETIEQIKNEAEPQTEAKRTVESYTPEDIVGFVKNYTFNIGNTINIVYNK
nr:hypothetical protein [Microctonus hyperodae filamentous virus]